MVKMADNVIADLESEIERLHSEIKVRQDKWTELSLQASALTQVRNRMAEHLDELDDPFFVLRGKR